MDNQIKHHKWGKRHIFMFMTFCLLLLRDLLCDNLSVAIVAMVKQGICLFCLFGRLHRNEGKWVFHISWILPVNGVCINPYTHIHAGLIILPIMALISYH